MQRSLFAIHLVDEISDPFFVRRARQARVIGVDVNDNQYVLKRLEDGALLPLTEWICHHLCRLVGIATPEFSVVIRQNGEPAFGSRIDENLIDFNKPPLLPEPRRMAIVQDADESQSATLALDAPLTNMDRHFGNWLYAVRRNRHVALAIDFGMVTAFCDPVFSRFPWPVDCRSAETLSLLERYGAFHVARFRETLTELGKVSDDDLKAIINAAPTSWLVELDEDATLSWWRAHLAQRIIDSERFILT